MIHCYALTSETQPTNSRLFKALCCKVGAQFHVPHKCTVVVKTKDMENCILRIQKEKDFLLKHKNKTFVEILKYLTNSFNGIY